MWQKPKFSRSETGEMRVTTQSLLDSRFNSGDTLRVLRIETFKDALGIVTEAYVAQVDGLKLITDGEWSKTLIRTNCLRCTEKILRRQHDSALYETSRDLLTKTLHKHYEHS